MIVRDNGHDIVIWHIIVYHIMQKFDTDNNTIWKLYNVFYHTFFQYTTMKYKPYPKTIAPYDILYD